MSSGTVSRTYPISAIRSDFPILESSMRGKPLAYLDNGATSLKPRSVVDAEVEYLTTVSANIHRGVYELSETATLRFDEARGAVKRFLHARDDGELVFTKGATEASNLVAVGWGRKFLTSGDEIVLTELEHHANFIPWQQVAAATGATIRFVPLEPGGIVTSEAVESVMGERTRIVAVSGMSNVTGYMPPIAEIARIAHAAGAVVAVDGAQLVSHHRVDVGELDCDFLSFSAHKMCGPTGVGALYAKKELLDQMDPLLYGGDMIVRVTRDGATFLGAPEKFETGTPNISGVFGFKAAVDYLSDIGMDAIADHEHQLFRYAVARIREVPGVTLYGPIEEGLADQVSGILSFNVGDLHPHDVGTVLDNEGVAVRTGFHCAQPLMRVLGVPGTVRASFYLYNTEEEVDRLVSGLQKAIDLFS